MEYSCIVHNKRYIEISYQVINF